MARRQNNRLTAATVKAATKPGRYGDGRGLMLNIAKGGSKSWVQRLVIRGVRRDIGIGSAQYTSLKAARDIAYHNAQIARSGGDPRISKVKTFDQAQALCLAEKEKSWKPSSRSPRDWRSSMERYVLPKIGAMPVGEVSGPDIRAILLPIVESGKHVQARTIGGRIKAVLDWSTAEGHREAGNPVDAVIATLPKRKTK